jgi:hypothetical protein
VARYVEPVPLPLTSHALLALLALLAVAAPICALVLWTRVRGPRALRVLQRLSMLVLSQLTAILLVAAALNDWGYFYGSWSELFGSTFSAQHVTAQHAGGLQRQPEVTVLAKYAWQTGKPRADVGDVIHVRLSAPRSGVASMEGYVYLPPQYFQSQWSSTSFPAVLTLTGYPGNPLNLVRRLKYPDRLLTQIQSGDAGPMVLVMLRPTVANPRDTECTNVPEGPQAETFFAQDVPADIASRFRVRVGDWGAIGDSVGAYCALKLTMKYSTTYRAAVSLSGYFAAADDATTGDLFNGDEQLRDLDDLSWRLRHLPPPPISALLTVGHDEEGGRADQQARDFMSLVEPPMSVDTLFTSVGGHNFRAWSELLPRALSWLSTGLTTSAAQ